MEDTAMPSQVEEQAEEAADADGDVDMNQSQSQSQSQTQGRDQLPDPTKKDVKLEDLFADDDSDEEFPSSAPVKQHAPSSPPLEDIALPR